MKSRQYYYYLIHFQFLGFRYHGWMKQPGVKTVQGVIDKTLSYVLGHEEHKTLGAGRTDARVSANEAALELFSRKPTDPNKLLEDLNLNLPQDIRILQVQEVDAGFNIIQKPKLKEYLYLFSHGEKNHPFCAPFMVYVQEVLNIELMKEGAGLFKGTHNFKPYCYKPGEKTEFEREILRCEIVENDLFTASFFPDKSYIFRVHGKGFLRHQVRLMMGALFELGKGRLSLENIRMSLEGEPLELFTSIAPQSGLMLNKLAFEE